MPASQRSFGHRRNGRRIVREPRSTKFAAAPGARGPRGFTQTCRASREYLTATQSRSVRYGYVCGVSMRLRAGRPASRGVAAGPAVAGQPGRWPAESTAARSLAKNGLMMDVSLPCAGATGRTSAPGWSARGGRWRSAGTRERTWRRSRRRKRRDGASGAENSCDPGTGAGANGCRLLIGTNGAQLPATAATATSRETSAWTAGHAGTTFREIGTMQGRASAPHVANGGSAPNPKHVQRAGREPVGDCPGVGGGTARVGDPVALREKSAGGSEHGNRASVGNPPRFARQFPLSQSGGSPTPGTPFAHRVPTTSSAGRRL